MNDKTEKLKYLIMKVFDMMFVHCNYGLFHQLTWQKIDAHDECVKAIAAVARGKGEKHE